jgi:sulfite oxidase
MRGLALAVTAALAGGGLWAWQQQAGLPPAAPPYLGLNTAHCKAEHRSYTKDEVAKHKTKQDRIWVTYKDGVYDITDFVEGHPGGSARIMMAAGSSIDPFWSMYRQHQNPEVNKILEQHRIGSLEGGAAQVEVQDPYQNEPERHPALIVRSAKPFNAETPRVLLGEQLNTPNELFYVRHHLPVPHIKADDYRLTIEGEGCRSVHLTLDDLKSKFKKHTVAAALQCTGNRRHELKEIKEVQGLDWDVGAIGNAAWSGVRLSDVLKYAGFDLEESPEVEHIQFEGYDNDGAGTSYGASIPVQRAVYPHYDVLLAYEMNGQELPQDHGYPVRVVTPGITGARAVKWVKRISPARQESQSQWQQRDYKSFNPGVGWDDVDWSSAPAIQDVPVTSAITDPPAGASIDPDEDEVSLKGYAWSGSGNGIIRVDITADGGKSWTSANLQHHELGQKRGSEWAWTLWDVTLPLEKADRSKPLQLAVRAVDAAYNAQPESAAPIWNLRGVLCNSWHRVELDWRNESDVGQEQLAADVK